MNYNFVKCEFLEINELVNSYTKSLSSPIESFLEDHILKSEHFCIVLDDVRIGYFSINNSKLLTQFFIEQKYRNLGQEMLFKIKRMQNLQFAFVPTCDEFFLSHAIDSYKSVDTQAFFFQDSKKAIDNKNFIESISLRLAKKNDIEDIKSNSGDFFDKFDKRIEKEEIYIASKDGQDVGYGIMENSNILDNHTSMGMFVVEKHRKQGVGRNILILLKNEAYKKHLIPIAGCWYYNHNSKKTLESAGMYSNTRLLKFGF